MISVEEKLLCGECDDCDQDPTRCFNNGQCRYEAPPEIQQEIFVEVECHICKTIHSIKITEEQAEELRDLDRRKIQDILPNHKPAERELFISQTCGKCFDEMFKEQDDESDMPEES